MRKWLGAAHELRRCGGEAATVGRRLHAGNMRCNPHSLRQASGCRLHLAQPGCASWAHCQAGMQRCRRPRLRLRYRATPHLRVARSAPAASVRYPVSSLGVSKGSAALGGWNADELMNEAAMHRTLTQQGTAPS